MPNIQTKIFITSNPVASLWIRERFLERNSKMSKVVKLTAKPIQVEAIQWDNNEPEIREWVDDDKNLHFKDGGVLEVWNREEASWINVPPFHYIIKGLKGELSSISPEVLSRSYEIID